MGEFTVGVMAIDGVGEAGIRFGCPSVMLLKHIHCPILKSAMKLN